MTEQEKLRYLKEIDRLRVILANVAKEAGSALPTLSLHCSQEAHRRVLALVGEAGFDRLGNPNENFREVWPPETLTEDDLRKLGEID